MKVLLLLTIIFPVAAANADPVDSILLAKSPHNLTLSQSVEMSTDSKHMQFSDRRPGLLSLLMRSRSIRLIELIDKPARQVFIGVDSNGTFGLHVLSRPE